MKILFIPWESAGREDLLEAFIQEGHSLIDSPVSLEKKTYADLPEIEKKLSEILYKEHPDIVFTVNYYPAISDFCNERGIRYVSWTYDSPYSVLYSETIINPCNMIYTLDKEVFMEFHKAGISTVHYLPMAANTERLDAMPKDLPFIYNVSFVGSLYLEGKQYAFDQVYASVPDYAKGYLDAIVAAQLKVQGYDFIEEILGPVIEDLRKVYPIRNEPKSLQSDENFYAQKIINPWITAVERIDLIEVVAKNYGMDFFAHHKELVLPKLRNRGSVDYYKEMPLVFRQSKINLNISRRGMKSAVPLRCFDIMGCGGFLLSNFQSGFLDMFVPGEDFVYYESKKDLIQKIGYYLNHEEERMAIARNGYEKVAASHTYRHRVREMLDF